jgi:hypothetical protein
MKPLHNLKLQFLLLASAPLLRRAARRSKRFQQMLRDEPFVLQILSRDGAAGYFELMEGRLRLHLGRHPRPSFLQTWATSKDAARVMMSRDEADLMRAHEEGQCELAGSFLVAMWFNEAMKIARNA